MKKLFLIAISSIASLLLTSCGVYGPVHDQLGKPPRTTSKSFLKLMQSPGWGFRNLKTQDASHMEIVEELSNATTKEEHAAIMKKHTPKLTEEGKIREKITFEMFKKLRNDYMNKSISCDTKQVNLEKYAMEYFNTAKQRDWIDYKEVSPDTTIEKNFQRYLDSASYPCSKYKKEQMRLEFTKPASNFGRCRKYEEVEIYLCEDTRKILEQYDPEFLQLIDANGIENM